MAAASDDDPPSPLCAGMRLVTSTWKQGSWPYSSQRRCAATHTVFLRGSTPTSSLMRRPGSRPDSSQTSSSSARETATITESARW